MRHTNVEPRTNDGAAHMRRRWSRRAHRVALAVVGVAAISTPTLAQAQATIGTTPDTYPEAYRFIQRDAQRLFSSTLAGKAIRVSSAAKKGTDGMQKTVRETFKAPSNGTVAEVYAAWKLAMPGAVQKLIAKMGTSTALGQLPPTKGLTKDLVSQTPDSIQGSVNNPGDLPLSSRYTKRHEIVLELLIGQ